MTQAVTIKLVPSLGMTAETAIKVSEIIGLIQCSMNDIEEELKKANQACAKAVMKANQFEVEAAIREISRLNGLKEGFESCSKLIEVKMNN
ncbi:MAG: hypothetical protein PHV37_01905 [Candidatus Gastranaerophilales bacterium]|nr:hypothetical protein [Candidatus Gastranaerophilales bacterium]